MLTAKNGTPKAKHLKQSKTYIKQNKDIFAWKQEDDPAKLAEIRIQQEFFR